MMNATMTKFWGEFAYCENKMTKILKIGYEYLLLRFCSFHVKFVNVKIS